MLKILSRRAPLHGYAIMTAIEEIAGEVLRVEEGSLDRCRRRGATRAQAGIGAPPCPGSDVFEISSAALAFRAISNEELESHIDEAMARGRSAAEARIALGGGLLHRERSRDIRLLPRLDALASDVVFGWRQLKKNRVVSAAAVLSGIFAMVLLGLAIGLAGGLASGRFLDALLFGVRPTDAGAVAAPILTLLGAVVLAALPPAIRAVRIDPARTLRSE